MSTKIAVFVLSLMAPWVSAQQTDSTRIIYSAETDSLPPKQDTRLIKTLYRRFIRAQIEEKTLIKFGILPTAFGVTPENGFSWGFRNEVAIEQKLTPAFSIFLSAYTYYRRLNKVTDDASISGILAGRWYFLMNRRIRQGKSANNFSDQYLSLQLTKPIWVKDSPFVPANGLTYSWLGVGLGAQRRLSKFGYLDANIGVGYTIASANPIPVNIRASLLVGLGL